MKCIAVDDEQLVLDLMVDYIRQVSYLHLIKACRNALEATDILQHEKIDLIFLDIQMPKINGLNFIKTLPQPPLIILVTAYEQYALESYNLDIVDYLLKPVSFERFLKACNKARELFQLRNEKTSPGATQIPDHIFVHVEYKLVKVLFDDILFIEGLKDYIKIHTTSSHRPILTRMTMKAFEEKLPPNKFVRTHKSFIVSVQKIVSINRNLLTIGNHEVPVSEVYKENVSNAINK